MNSKMTTNSQLSTTESKRKQKQTKQTTRTGKELQKWRSHGGLSAGSGNGGMGRKVQGRRTIISKHKLDGERSKMV